MSFPNHYPALQVLVKLYLAKKSALPLPPECWFYRAIVFRPKDATTYQAFGVYMQRRGRLKDAVNLYKQSLALHPNNPEVHYDLGLALAKLGRYAEARSQAQLAYAGGYPLPGLRNILKRAGHWSDSPKGSGLQHKSH
jgi:tetratricopeptide (TPR) repeat protein